MVGAALKRKFVLETRDVLAPSVVVYAVRLPTGAIETIISHDSLKEKLIYLIDAYDEDFKLRTQPEVQIVGYILV